MTKPKKTTKKVKPTAPEPTKPNLIEPGSYSVVYSRDEMISSVQMLSFGQTVFEQIAVTCHKEGNDKSMEMWAARSKLCAMLCEKLRNIAKIGEPTSREVH